LLAGAEQALRAAQVNDKLLMTYEDYNESLSTPWESEKQSAVPVVQKGVDLGPMRSLLATLKTADPGVFSNAAWLMFLEREYHRSQRQRRALLTMLLRLRRFEINSNHPEHLVPQAALHEALRRLEKLQSKGDILGQFGEGDYALLRPNASLKSLENLSRQIKNSLLELPLSDEFDHQYLRVGVQINAVFGHTSLPEMLMLHPILS
jgi:GGDEF domain-containing protein